MIVKNERERLPTCLDSVRDLVSEIIVVDTGSTDGTQHVAEEWGARLIRGSWENDFSRARNLSIEPATGQWILVLDADELLLEKDRLAIRRLVQDNTEAEGRGTAAFNLMQKSTGDGGQTGMLVRIVRLFPNRAGVRYEWPIHEQVVTSLLRFGIPVINTEIEIMHAGYASPELNQKKQRRNLAILQAQVDSGREVHSLTYFLLGGAYLDLGEIPAAVDAYESCVELAPSGSELSRGAQVRIATCLLKLKRFDEVIAVMPSAYEESWHPELRTMRGAAAAALGRSDEARLWYERVFSCTNRAFVPPCNLAYEKSEALIYLGGYWREKGRAALGVSLLKSALAARQHGKDFSSEELAELYRHHGVR